LFTEVFCFVIAVKILRQLQANSVYFSLSTYRMHRELTYCLIGQVYTNTYLYIIGNLPKITTFCLIMYFKF
jgi:hypothetical protein